MKFTSTQSTRINKAVQKSGLYSRREADSLIEGGKIFVNNKRAVLGQVIKSGDIIDIRIENKINKYALYYKPKGEVTSISSKEKLQNLHPVGRLDKESEGLLIYTNDHRLVDALLNPLNKIEKEYRVKIREKATPRVERILKQGIQTQEATYSPVKNVRMSEDCRTLYITLTEGKKHEIRRMMNALFLTIDSLIRIRIEKFTVKNMKPGQVQELAEADFDFIFRNQK
ncbi:MAG: rRNA pseudouridine2604 synthase [Patescibacteria group bacterium]|nr:rRNA pseudouridine2604 synthase [Patescibacteria group bacterium]